MKLDAAQHLCDAFYNLFQKIFEAYDDAPCRFTIEVEEHFYYLIRDSVIKKLKTEPHNTSVVAARDLVKFAGPSGWIIVKSEDREHIRVSSR